MSALLVVEDNPGDVQLLREAIQELQLPLTLDPVPDAPGCRARLAARQAAGAPPQAILCDVNLPGGSGLALIRALRAEGLPAALPVVVWSSAEVHRCAEEARRLGVTLLCDKPAVFAGYLELARRLLALVSPATDVEALAGGGWPAQA